MTTQVHDGNGTAYRSALMEVCRDGYVLGQENRDGGARAVLGKMGEKQLVGELAWKSVRSGLGSGSDVNGVIRARSSRDFLMEGWHVWVGFSMTARLLGLAR
jgi:hypothetical protein